MVLDPNQCGGMTEAVRVLTPSAGHSLTLKKKSLRGEMAVYLKLVRMNRSFYKDFFL